MSLVTSRVPTVAIVRPFCVVQVVVVVVVARVDPIVHRSSWQSTFESWWRCRCALAVRLFVRHRHQTKPGFDGALLGRVSARTHRFQVHQRRTARVRRRHGRAIDPRQPKNDAHAMRPRRTCAVRSNEKGDVEGATQHTCWKRHKRSQGIDMSEHEPTVPENARVEVSGCGIRQNYTMESAGGTSAEEEGVGLAYWCGEVANRLSATFNVVRSVYDWRNSGCCTNKGTVSL